jgi:hypothetical protein
MRRDIWTEPIARAVEYVEPWRGEYRGKVQDKSRLWRQFSFSFSGGWVTGYVGTSSMPSLSPITLDHLFVTPKPSSQNPQDQDERLPAELRPISHSIVLYTESQQQYE